MQLAFMNEDANPLVAMHCLAAADALVLPFHKGDRMAPPSNPSTSPNPGPCSKLDPDPDPTPTPFATPSPNHTGDRMGPSSFALMAATLGRGSVIQTAEELLERVERINGGSPDAWADSFVQHVLSPQGTFAAEGEGGGYSQEQLPTPEDPL